MLCFLSGCVYPRLQGPQWGVDTAAEGPDHQVRYVVSLSLSVEWTKLQLLLFFNLFLFTNSSSDLSKAEPTLTHICIRMLHKEKLVREP